MKLINQKKGLFRVYFQMFFSVLFDINMCLESKTCFLKNNSIEEQICLYES